MVGIFKTKKDWFELFKVAIIAGYFQSIYALSQYFNLSFALKTTSERINGSLGNPSFLATYLIFIIFIAGYLYTKTTSKIKWSCAALILIDIFLLWQTQTRGAILAFIFGLLFFISTKLWQSKKPRAKIILFIFILALFILPAILSVNKKTSWVRSSNTLERLATISLTDVSTQNRLIVWGVGGKAFKEKFWLGWGWENFDAAFNKYFNPILTRDIGSHPWYDRAHNVIIETAVATGITGLLLYLAIIGWTIKLAWAGQKNNQFSLTTSLLIITLLLVHFLQNLFVFDTLNSYLMFFLILAFIQSQQPLPVEKFKKPLVVGRGKTIFIAILLLIVIAPLAYFLNIRPALANYYLIQAVTKRKTDPEGMLKSFQKSFTYSPANDRELRFILIQHTRDQINLRGINQETIPLIQFALEETKKSIQVSPSYVQNYLLLAELYLSASQLNPQYIQLAQDVTLKALEKAPGRYQVYTLLGRLKISQKQFEEAINYFQQAIELNDQFAEAHWNLAIAYILSWQPELAQQSLDKAMAKRLDIYDQKYINLLLLAYKDSKNLDATIDFLENLIQRFPDNQYYQDSLKSLKEINQQMIKSSQ